MSQETDPGRRPVAARFDTASARAARPGTSRQIASRSSGTSDRSRRIGTGSSSRTRRNTSRRRFAAKRRRLREDFVQDCSQRIASVRESSSRTRPAACSGSHVGGRADRGAGVRQHRAPGLPAAWPCRSRSNFGTSDCGPPEEPQSIPRATTSTLPGLMSRCRTPRLWACCTAAATVERSCAACRTDTLPCCAASHSERVGPSQYSAAM